MAVRPSLQGHLRLSLLPGVWPSRLPRPGVPAELLAQLEKDNGPGGSQMAVASWRVFQNLSRWRQAHLGRTNTRAANHLLVWLLKPKGSACGIKDMYFDRR